MYTTHTSLLARVQQGDEISWSEFFQQYEGLFRKLGGISGLNDDECDELVQRMMVTIFTNQSVLKYDKERGTFRTYLRGILSHKINDLLRERMKNVDSLDEHEGEVINGLKVESFYEQFEQEYQQQTFSQLNELLRQMVEPKTYHAFQMSWMQDKPVKEVAEILNMSVDMVYQSRSRCLKHLQELAQQIQREDADFSLDWKKNANSEDQKN